MRQIDFLDIGAQRSADKPCLVGPNLSLTYRQAQALSHRIANAIRATGAKGVGTLSPNHVLGFAVLLGVFRSETLSMALNARSATAENAAHLAMGDADILFYHGDLEDEAERLAAATPALQLLVCIDREGRLGPSLEEWIAGHSDVASEWLPEDHYRIYRITMTGGTTGRPKGVLHAHIQAEVNTMAFLATLHYDIEPRYLMVAPMTHAAGLVSFHVLALGGQIHFPARGNAAAIRDAIGAARITTTVLPPTVLYDMLATLAPERHDNSSMRYMLVGTAPVSLEKMREAVRVFGPCIGQIYGQSECPMACYLSPSEVGEAIADATLAHRLLSCGRTLPSTVVAIMGPEGRLLPDGERGEIVMRSSQLMRGYLDNPEATAEAGAHGWHHTSDIGYRDADGFVYIVDRKRDLIISGGFNVYPSEVEQVIWTHPAVQDCAVIGVPDDRWGEAVKAVVLLKPGASATEDELIALCKQCVGSIKTPKTIEFWPDLPRSPVGKVLKRVIRDRFWADSGRVI